jgi:hypothetical protein
MSITRLLPTYTDTKGYPVAALQISHVIPSPRGYLIGFVDQGYAPEEVSHEWFHRHNPQPDGYFVVCNSGFRIYEPVGTFEAKYTLVTS